MLDKVEQILGAAIQSGGMWLPIALIIALVVMQAVKAAVKALWPSFAPVRLRQWLIFILAYLVGYRCGIWFIDSPDAEKWAVVVGLVNPVIYFGLVQYAVAKNRLILLSVLKMRSIKRDATGNLALDETQRLWAGRR